LAGSPPAIQLNSSHLTSTKNYGRCRPSSISPALSTECREVRRCGRSWRNKSSSTELIETTRSLIVRDETRCGGASDHHPSPEPDCDEDNCGRGDFDRFHEFTKVLEAAMSSVCLMFVLR
ncbi:MAG: hypothetical protein K0S98_2312, partial [Propionibacteriaceae bacterium]|nr:hypothetical protein [Propionibacteriaceae bacterium]